MENNLSANLNVIITACQKISRFVLRDFGEIELLQSSINGSEKFANVSRMKIEKTLIENLLEARPKFGILTSNKEIRGADISHRFIINTIDGFGNFSRGIPLFSIAIALQEQKSITDCVIYNPVLDKFFFASRGGGAFLMEARMTRRLRVGGRKNPIESLINFSGVDIEKLKLKINLPFINMGCDACSLAYLSGGMIDAYLGQGRSVFDIIAGSLLIQEAGGIVRAYDKSGKVTEDISEANFVICGNSYLTAELTSIIIK